MTERNDARDPQRSARAAPPEGATLERELPGTREPDVLRDARDDARRTEPEGAGRMGRPASDPGSGGEALVMEQERPESWTFDDDERLRDFLAAQPALIGVMIHIVGPTDQPRILLTPAVVARMGLDEIQWRAGANCGEWEVTFPAGSPLVPDGPYSSNGGNGGLADALGIHKYDIRAVDARTGRALELDPDVVIIPGL